MKMDNNSIPIQIQLPITSIQLFSRPTRWWHPNSGML